MSLVNRSRFTSLLKGLAGIRGPFSLDVDTGLMPVVEVAGKRIEFDDDTAYWYGGSTVAAVAGQFSFLQIKVGAGRAVIDGFIIRHVAAVGLRVGLLADIAGAGQPANVRNPYLFVAGAPATPNLAAITFLGSTQAADPFAAGAQLALDALAPGTPATFYPLEWALVPGRAFTISAGSVNTAQSVSVIGRWFADVS